MRTAPTDDRNDGTSWIAHDACWLTSRCTRAALDGQQQTNGQMGGQFWQKNNPARRESRFSGSEQVKNITSCIVGAFLPPPPPPKSRPPFPLFLWRCASLSLTCAASRSSSSLIDGQNGSMSTSSGGGGGNGSSRAGRAMMQTQSNQPASQSGRRKPQAAHRSERARSASSNSTRRLHLSSLTRHWSFGRHSNGQLAGLVSLACSLASPAASARKKMSFLLSKSIVVWCSISRSVVTIIHISSSPLSGILRELDPHSSRANPLRFEPHELDTTNIGSRYLQIEPRGGDSCAPPPPPPLLPVAQRCSGARAPPGGRKTHQPC